MNSEMAKIAFKLSTIAGEILKYQYLKCLKLRSNCPPWLETFLKNSGIIGGFFEVLGDFHFSEFSGAFSGAKCYFRYNSAAMRKMYVNTLDSGQ